MTLLRLPLKVNLDRPQFTHQKFYQLRLRNLELTIERKRISLSTGTDAV
ncbi:MAG: hypothetical protein JGK27_18955 [Microcoleus sp. PH2017_20_SFW_D_A]|nr:MULTISPECIES: hypothetical protein [unclassified Microcoleus]MCC3503160.1 hypothetical protein [Microcoleus sp. PH2017_19_SFW_U_A]MCC3523759.1 hypothetical protein [Microcoleus sp. PH2017_20_SFW_D_A]MCC3554233.1 hypothetical protein [Microcoleus sp. PH2017_35_SFW_U_B]MCC3473882.1 hypothetical protein [Microcoleus sp. PH2017_13_LAR_U_A]MCC3623855.1 hypothetical protein [Microcoleus sp. PH2017_36_ELK_O_B]